MSAQGGAVLYTPRILALAVELADYPLLPELDRRGAAQSRICGSRIEFGAGLDGDGRIACVGARVSACAIGQAAAALFLRAAAGHDAAELERAEREVEAWLGSDGPLPGWPDIAELQAARAHAGRHGAILLPWRAARDALCKVASPG